MKAELKPFGDHWVLLRENITLAMAFPTHESKRALMNFLVETKKFEGMLQNNWYGFIEGSWKCELNGSYAKLNPV